MAESCRSDCPIFLLSKGHVVCSPLVRQAVQQRVLSFMDRNGEESAAAVGPIAADVFDEVDERIETLDRRLNQVARICPGRRLASVSGKLALACGGFNEAELEAILDSQQEMFHRLRPNQQ